MSENELADVVGDIPAIPAEEPAPEPEATATEAPEEKKPDDPPDPAALKAEIEQLKADKKAAKEAAQKWRREKAEARADFFKSREPAPAATPAPAETTRPDPDSFDDYNDYVDALTDWKVDLKKADWDRAEAQKKESQSYQQKMQDLQVKIDAGFEKYPDFEDVALAETVPINPMIQEILAETENPADIAYYLGKNRTECIAIRNMAPIAAARAIAKIEAKVTDGNTAPKTKKITDAPPPIKPVGSSNTVQKDPAKMTQKEYEAWRESQGARHH